MDAKLYALVENIVAVLCCLIIPTFFVALWLLGLMPIHDVQLSIVILLFSTIVNVGLTFFAVKVIIPVILKRRRKRKPRKRRKL